MLNILKTVLYEIYHYRSTFSDPVFFMLATCSRDLLPVDFFLAYFTAFSDPGIHAGFDL